MFPAPLILFDLQEPELSTEEHIIATGYRVECFRVSKTRHENLTMSSNESHVAEMTRAEVILFDRRDLSDKGWGQLRA